MTTQSAKRSISSDPSDNSFPKSLFQVGASLLLILGLGFTGLMQAPGASAQALSESSANKATVPSRWAVHFDKQTARSLRQKPSMRASHIRVVLNVTDNHENLNLSRTVGALLHVIEKDPSHMHRLMAIQALHEIGSEHASEKRYRQAMSRLQALMQNESSEQVRSVAIGTLAHYSNSG